MKKFAVIVIIAVGMFHSLINTSFQNYDFPKTQNERIESQIQEEMFFNISDEIQNTANDVFFNLTSLESISLNKSRIWKPPVNL